MVSSTVAPSAHGMVMPYQAEYVTLSPGPTAEAARRPVGTRNFRVDTGGRQAPVEQTAVPLGLDGHGFVIWTIRCSP